MYKTLSPLSQYQIFLLLTYIELFGSILSYFALYCIELCFQ